MKHTMLPDFTGIVLTPLTKYINISYYLFNFHDGL